MSIPYIPNINANQATKEQKIALIVTYLKVEMQSLVYELLQAVEKFEIINLALNPSIIRPQEQGFYINN